MHIHFLDPYKPRPSLVHELDPRIKFILTVAFILTTALTPPAAWPAYTLLLAVVWAVAMLSELGLPFILKRSLIAVPFVLAAFPIIFTMEGPTLFSFNIGAWTISLSQTGLERFISIALKSWISVQAAIILAASTPFPELLQAMRAVKIPRLLVAIFGLMWRYLFVLADEALRLLRARSARSGNGDPAREKSGGSVVWRARVAGGMAGSLLLRGIERSDRIYNAMLARGYDGEVRAIPLPAMRMNHWLVLFIGLIILLILLTLSYIIFA